MSRPRSRVLGAHSRCRLGVEPGRERTQRPVSFSANLFPPRSRVLAAATLVFLVAFSVAAIPMRPTQHYTTEDGLAGAVVRSIERTPEGVMWFGCWGRGVTSYDGLHWKSYGIAEGLPSLDVRAVRMDTRGCMWVGTVDGIACLAGDQWVTMGAAVSGGRPPAVFTICPLPDGSVWFGLEGGRIITFAPEGPTEVDAPPEGRWPVMLEKPELGAIRALHARPDGSVVAGGDSGGILRWRNGAWTQDAGDDAIDTLRDITETAGGVLYAGAETGLWRRAPEDPGWTLESLGPVSSVTPLAGEGIAAAYRDRVELRRGHVVERLNLLQDTPVLAMQVIRRFPDVDELWLGSKLGAFRVGNQGWTRYSKSPDGFRLSGRALFADAGTPATAVDVRGNLLQYAGGAWRVIGKLDPGGYTSMSKGRDNTIWLVARGQGIQWDLGAGAVRARVALPADVESMLETRAGRLFASSLDRLFEWVAGEWAETPAGPNDRGEAVSTVFETSGGDLIVSTLTALTLWGLPEEGGLRVLHRFTSEKNFRGFVEEPDGSILVLRPAYPDLELFSISRDLIGLQGYT